VGMWILSCVGSGVGGVWISPGFCVVRVVELGMTGCVGVFGGRTPQPAVVSRLLWLCGCFYRAREHILGWAVASQQGRTCPPVCGPSRMKQPVTFSVAVLVVADC